jgi:hypothetical protein
MGARKPEKIYARVPTSSRFHTSSPTRSHNYVRFVAVKLGLSGAKSGVEIVVVVQRWVDDLVPVMG